jgi:hypothetical protein
MAARSSTDWYSSASSVNDIQIVNPYIAHRFLRLEISNSD